MSGEKEKGDVDGAAEEGEAREAKGGEENSSKESNKKVKKKVSLFGFPEEKDEPELRKKWLAPLPRRTAPGKYDPFCHAKLCEIHFLPSDFKEERGDKTRGQAKKRGSLVRKYLKPGVIPSIWPNLPLHLSKEPPPPRHLQRWPHHLREK